MKRPRPASKHSFLDVYSSTLSYAFFIRNTDDETRVMKALLRRDFQPLEIKQLLLKVILYRLPRRVVATSLLNPFSCRTTHTRGRAYGDESDRLVSWPAGLTPFFWHSVRFYALSPRRCYYPGRSHSGKSPPHTIFYDVFPFNRMYSCVRCLHERVCDLRPQGRCC